ncbi:MAG: hypothetical protein HZB11_03070 [Candidatus Yonathbacteria bacterium]|nr:hypothetical protein [Candidatus Yonathbacteria bacterium]
MSKIGFLRLIIFVTLFVFVLWNISVYLDRPTVEVSVNTGKCLRAYGPHGPMPCKEAMKGRYEKVIVDF